MASTKEQMQPVSRETWTSDTKTYFQIRLHEIESILEVLIKNLCDYKEGDGMADGKTLHLALQLIESTIREMEDRSYELDRHAGAGVGDLSLYLMLGRALMEILVGMGEADSWEYDIREDVLTGYLAGVGRQVKLARAQAVLIDAHYAKTGGDHGQ